MLAAVAAEDHRKEYSIRPRQLLRSVLVPLFCSAASPSLFTLLRLGGARSFVFLLEPR